MTGRRAGHPGTMNLTSLLPTILLGGLLAVSAAGTTSPSSQDEPVVQLTLTPAR